MWKKIQQRRVKGWSFVSRLTLSVFFIAFYLSWFFRVEGREVSYYHVLHTPLDDMIPFLPIFVIPYISWFFYMLVVIGMFGLFDKDGWEFFRMALSQVSMCVIFLLISIHYPNAQDLRPDTLPQGILGDIISRLYKIDTPTDVLPSIHVFNSLVCSTATWKSKIFFKEKKDLWMKVIIVIWGWLIILSTMFLKQHSTIDVGAAFLAFGVYYVLWITADKLKEKYAGMVNKK